MSFFFDSCVVERGEDGLIAIALIDHGFDEEHILIARCHVAAASVLRIALSSVLRTEQTDETRR